MNEKNPMYTQQNLSMSITINYINYTFIKKEKEWDAFWIKLCSISDLYQIDIDIWFNFRLDNIYLTVQ